MYHPLKDGIPRPGIEFTLACVERNGLKVMTDSHGFPNWVPSNLIYRIEIDGQVITKPPRPTDAKMDWSSVGKLLDAWWECNKDYINPHT